MEQKAEAIELELETCPISNQIFRHPILASDGYHYELMALYENAAAANLISPMTGEQITTYVYDLFLHSELEKGTYDNRYPDYDKNTILFQFSKVFTFPASMYKSNLVALTLGLFPILKNESTSPLMIFSIVLISGLIDYGIRLRSDHQFGFFGGAHRLWNLLSKIEPEEMPCTGAY